jgi:hypothetical protein
LPGGNGSSGKPSASRRAFSCTARQPLCDPSGEQKVDEEGAQWPEDAADHHRAKQPYPRQVALVTRLCEKSLEFALCRPT